jgi:hypothetical protein
VNRTSRGSATTSSRGPAATAIHSRKANKNRATFRPTARGAPDGHWPPEDLRDGQEPTAIGAKGTGQVGDADVVGHIRRLLKSRSARAPNGCRGRIDWPGPFRQDVNRPDRWKPVRRAAPVAHPRPRAIESCRLGPTQVGRDVYSLHQISQFGLGNGRSEGVPRHVGTSSPRPRRRRPPLRPEPRSPGSCCR